MRSESLPRHVGPRRGRPPKAIAAEKSPLSRLGGALRRAREAAGLSLSGFAEWSGYSSSHLSRVEHGRATPSRELVEIYEARLNTDGLLRALYAMVLDAQEDARRARRGVSPGGQGSQTIPRPRTRPGDRSEFVADLTIPDGSVVSPSAHLIKRWRIRNAGSAPWRGRALERVGATTGPAVITSPHRVPIPDAMPGETTDITVDIEAPWLPGSTIAYWQMVDAEGRPCYPDRYADGIYVQLVVVDESS